MRLLIAVDEADLAEALTVFLRKIIFRRTPSTTGGTPMTTPLPAHMTR